MSFLYPLYALGLAAVAAPILLHLIRRMTRRQVPFSTLMFLQPSPPRIDRRSRLEHLLLLLLRCAAIALLALAFTRPFVRNADFVPPGGAQTARVVLLMDVSASMRRGDLMAQLRGRAAREIESLAPGDELALVAFDDRPRLLTGFEQWRSASPDARRAAALAAVESLKPSWASTNLAVALTAAAEAIQDAALGKDAPLAGDQRVVLISDMQQGAAVDALAGYQWSPGVSVRIEPLAVAGGNAGLSLLIDAAQSMTDDAQPRLRVVNSADAATDQLRLRWSGDPAGEQAVYAPPGQSQVVRAPAPRAGVDRGRLELVGDAADFDNVLHLPSSSPAPIDVLYLGVDKDDDPAAPLYYLRSALQPTRTQQPRITVRPPDAIPDADQLHQFDLIVLAAPLASAAADQGAAAARLRARLHAGQTLWLVLRSPQQASDLATLAGVARLELQEADFKGYVMLSQIDRRHPLLSPFAEARFGDFTAIHFWKYRRLRAADLPGAAIAASFDSGDPAMLTLPVGRGQLIVFTSAWHPADSKLALSTKFVPLVWSVLEQAGVSAQHTVGVEVGRPLPLPVAEPAAVIRPDGRRVDLPPEARTYDQTDEPGLYTVLGRGDERVVMSVNLAASESRTAPMEVEKLEQLGVPLRSAASPAADAGREERRRRELAAADLEERQKGRRLALAAAMVVLLGETLLAGWYSRAARVPAPVGEPA
jgi:hypothetical protein